MALRNLAAKMRIPAPRLLSAPRVLPSSDSRALPFSSYSSSSLPSDIEVARLWYLAQRERYEGLTSELATLHRAVWWTEKLELFLRRFYLVAASLGAGGVFVEWLEYQERERDLVMATH